MNSFETYSGTKFSKGSLVAVNDILTVEEILNISVNGNPYTMTMRTPGDEEELVRGILLSEDVYDDPIQNPEFQILEKNEKGYITHANVIIAQDKIKNGIETQRNLVSVSSCGMCGKTEMELALHGNKLEAKQKLCLNNIENIFQKMSASQVLFKNSGGSHASAIFSQDGNLLSIKEDIGRHNAVDKAIGSLLVNKTLSQAHCLTVSGRVSYEIVSKCFKAAIPFLASVSAPSSMAIEYCEKTGITLLAFCRGEKCTIYSNPQNVTLE